MKKAIAALVVVGIAILSALLLLNFRTITNRTETELTNTQNTPSSTSADNASPQVSGTVLDGMTKQPLAAKVILKNNKQIVQTTECNASGEYALPSHNGKYQISAEYPGYVPRGRYDISHSIEINHETNKLNKIYLWPEAKIKGRLVSGDIGISSELSFTYQYDDSNAENYKFKTLSSDENGNFILGQAYGGILDIEITADGFVPQTLKDVEIDPGQTLDLGDIPLKTGTTVYGIVTDAETSTAIAGARLEYTDKSGNIMHTLSANDGSYKLPATDIQNLQISVVANGYKDIHESISTHGQKTYEYPIAMSKLAGIGILVSNQTGREPVQTIVTVTDIASEKVVYEKALDNGFYSLNELQQGPYLVKGVSADKLTETSARVLAGSTATLTLKPFAKLNVQFVIKKDDSPAKGTYRYIYKPNDNDEITTNWTPIPTDSDTVLIDQLMPGSYWIEARPDSFWESTEDRPGEMHISQSAMIPLQMGETRFVKLALTTSGTLRGKFKIPPKLAGKPIVAMAYRDSIEEDGSRSRSATSIQVDQNGEFITDELPEGEFSIYAFTPTGEASYFSGLQVKFDSDHVMDFDMSFSRKESENGVSLMMPRPTWTDEEFKAMSEEQKREVLPKYFASIDRWTEAIQEQERYQQAEAQRISEKAELDIEAE